MTETGKGDCHKRDPFAFKTKVSCMIYELSELVT